MEEQFNRELVNSVVGGGGGVTTSKTVIINVCYLIRVNRVSSQKRYTIQLDKTEKKQRQRTKTNTFETRL